MVIYCHLVRHNAANLILLYKWLKPAYKLEAITESCPLLNACKCFVSTTISPQYRIWEAILALWSIWPRYRLWSSNHLSAYMCGSANHQDTYHNDSFMRPGHSFSGHELHTSFMYFVTMGMRIIKYWFWQKCK